jgi:hypothetical protein
MLTKWLHYDHELYPHSRQEKYKEEKNEEAAAEIS